MLAHNAFAIALVASVLWFGSGFRFFSFKQGAAARLLFPGTARTEPHFRTMAAAIRFLGGMNGAFVLLCMILLIGLLTGSALFTAPSERAAILAVLGAAHFSQFIFNVPVWQQRDTRGEALWDVLSGRMWFIFVMDFVQAALCWLAAAVQLLG